MKSFAEFLIEHEVISKEMYSSALEIFAQRLTSLEKLVESEGILSRDEIESVKAKMGESHGSFARASQGLGLWDSKIEPALKVAATNVNIYQILIEQEYIEVSTLIKKLDDYMAEYEESFAKKVENEVFSESLDELEATTESDDSLETVEGRQTKEDQVQVLATRQKTQENNSAAEPLDGFDSILVNEFLNLLTDERRDLINVSIHEWRNALDPDQQNQAILDVIEELDTFKAGASFLGATAAETFLETAIRWLQSKNEEHSIDKHDIKLLIRILDATWAMRNDIEKNSSRTFYLDNNQSTLEELKLLMVEKTSESAA